jgi:hypothetical protein
LVHTGMGLPRFGAIFAVALGSYWPFVLVNLGHRWRNFPRQRLSPSDKSALFDPYLNVIRVDGGHIFFYHFGIRAFFDTRGGPRQTGKRRCDPVLCLQAQTDCMVLRMISCGHSEADWTAMDKDVLRAV